MTWGRREAQRPVRRNGIYLVQRTGRARRTWVWLGRKVRNTAMLFPGWWSLIWWLSVAGYMAIVAQIVTPGVALLTGAIVVLMALVIS